MTCEQPVAFEALVDYWLDGAQDVEAIEEHLFACAGCSGRLRGLVALGDGIRRLSREGAVEMIVTAGYLARATEEGLRTREYVVPPGGRVECTVTPEDDLLVGRLLGDFTGVSHLDLVAERAGYPARRIPDVPISPDARELIVAQAMPLVRTLQHAQLRLRLVSREAAGERLIGEYTFNHSPCQR